MHSVSKVAPNYFFMTNATARIALHNVLHVYSLSAAQTKATQQHMPEHTHVPICAINDQNDGQH